MPTLYELETRYCQCGCGATWKSLPSSKSRYCSLSHDPANALAISEKVLWGFFKSEWKPTDIPHEPEVSYESPQHDPAYVPIKAPVEGDE